jgi:hypothetical protein
MAFRAIPASKVPAKFKSHDDVSVKAIRSGKYITLQLSLPRLLLTASQLPDYPGATVGLMIGEGEDEGSIALIPGSDLTLRAVGATKNCRRVMLTTTRSGLKAPFALRRCAPDTGRRQIIIHLDNYKPAGGPE